ncbi:MAG: GNAT family N-acetyltransferase [Alphaproteobacteria bacterium]|nr:GNAT family N-acetyltransferase [Alphaproteobacteria bacterium]
MTVLGPTLETARLVLRPPVQADFDDFAAFCADEAVMRTLGGVAPRHGAWRQMAQLAGSWALLGFGMFSVIEKESGRWVGRLGPWQPGGEGGGWPDTEVGWGLVKEVQGKGYATEGAAAAIDWAFGTLGWTRVVHCIAKDNPASQAVARRLGSSVLAEEVMLPAPISVPIDLWGQTKTQWRARHRA